MTIMNRKDFCYCNELLSKLYAILLENNVPEDSEEMKAYRKLCLEIISVKEEKDGGM